MWSSCSISVYISRNFSSGMYLFSKVGCLSSIGVHQILIMFCIIWQRQWILFLKDFLFISSILNLYASGLLGSSSNQLKGEDTKKSGAALQVLLNNMERLQQVALSINWLNEHFDTAGKEKSSYGQGISHLPYWEALKFFCLSLAESVYFNRKEIFSEAETASCWEDLSGIHVAFRQYCHIFLYCLRYLTLCYMLYVDTCPSTGNISLNWKEALLCFIVFFSFWDIITL